MEIPDSKISINDITRVMIGGEWLAVERGSFHVCESWYVEWFIGGDPQSDKADRQSETFTGYEFKSPSAHLKYSGPLSAIQAVEEKE